MTTSCEGSLCSKKGEPRAFAASSQTSVLAHEHFRTPMDVRGLPSKQSVDSMAMPPLGKGLMNAVGGLISGVAVAGMFNPWGFSHAIFQRVLSSGLYFPLEDLCQRPLKNLTADDSHWALALAGCSAGAINAVLINPVVAIKYHIWGTVKDDANVYFREVARQMFQRGGYSPFLKGMRATMCRDVLFGGVFALLRYRPPPPPDPFSKERARSGTVEDPLSNPGKKFCLDCSAGLAATTLSSPFNYVRDMKYALHTSGVSASGTSIIRDLLHETQRRRSNYGLIHSIHYLHTRLRIGWGTLRVGVGMAVASQLYTVICSLDTAVTG